MTNWLIVGAIAIGLINIAMLASLRDYLRLKFHDLDFRTRHYDSIDLMFRHVWAKLDYESYRQWRMGERRWPEFVDREDSA